MNVVVVITDSLRADHVGAYGSHVKTPNLDTLAAEGTTFVNAYSENLPTMPTRRAWWTGKYHFHRAGWQPMANSDYLLAEILWDRGWTTAMISDVYHMHKTVYNCGRGFDTVEWIRGQEYDPWVVDRSIPVDVENSDVHRLKSHAKGRESDETWRSHFQQYLRNQTRVRSEEETYVARTLRQAARWVDDIGSQSEDPFFLWVDCFDPHEPWDAPEPYRHMYTDPDYDGQDIIDPVPGSVEGYMNPQEVENTKNLYAGEVTLVDKWVGTLFDKLKERGLWDDTLIVHSSDHGEPFGEHGYVRKAFPRGYEELTRVPLIIRHPDGIGRGQRPEGLVQAPDMLPTLLELMDIDATKLEFTYTEPQQSGTSRNIFPQDLPTIRNNVILTGKSMVPLMTGEKDEVRDYIFGGHHNREWFIKSHEWSYLMPIDGSRPSELLNLTVDPGEQTNIIADNQAKADEMELTVRRFLHELELQESGEVS
jgi:arylsulfatase A-like enzyme